MRDRVFDILISLMLDRRLDSIPKILHSLEVHSKRLYFLLGNNITLHKNGYVGKIKIATTREALSRAPLLSGGRLQKGVRELQYTRKRDD